MKTAALLAAATAVGAQTFEGFTVDVSQELGVIYNGESIDNGEQLPRPDVLSTPEISFQGSERFAQTGVACLIMIDSDVPANNTDRTTLLHWLAPSVTGSTSGQNTSILAVPPSESDSTTGGVPYLPPNPPQGDYPHRYTFLLYEQPRGFSVPESVSAAATNTTLRRGFDLQAFLDASGLRRPLAANYMLVANASGPATRSFPPQLYTASSTLNSAEAGATAVTTGSGSASAVPTSSAATESASASGTAANAPAATTAAGNVLRTGSGVALAAFMFGMMLM